MWVWILSISTSKLRKFKVLSSYQLYAGSVEGLFVLSTHVQFCMAIVFACVQHALCYCCKLAIINFSADRKFCKLTPSWETWNVMATFELALAPYAALTDAMSMEKTVGICELYPLLLKIERYSQQAVTSEDLSQEELNLAAAIRKRIWEYMDKRYALCSSENVHEFVRLPCICSRCRVRVIVCLV